MNPIKNDVEFALVLSGGGALGLAHLGVIEDLENLGKTPVEIVGTSMGGIIGACISIGMKEKEIYTLFEKFNSIFNWVGLSFSGNSIITKGKIEKIFRDVFGNRKMDDTDIDLKLVTTELYTGNIKIFTKHDDVDIVEALLATMAIPGVFEEQTIDGVIYVDGFLAANMAVEAVECDTMIAIDVLGKNSFTGIVVKEDNLFKTQNVLNMIERSMRILIFNQTREALKRISSKYYKYIILIDIDTKEFKTFQFNKLKEIKNIGLNLL